MTCAPGSTTDLEDGSPGTASFEMMNLPVAAILTQMVQTGLAHVSVNEVVIQNGVTTQQVSRVSSFVEVFYRKRCLISYVSRVSEDY